uniref:b(0,+)-type amino acid transporter 1 n=1 Tax=Ciona intestinalis TaxID=7719 RepID=UPI0000520D91|nr:b(0,+)-type amino acid transporter 1 [Ciona intestinalis]|eukprot:XP_002125910.1 b(0,+)-type amino acid transporter 1 [Ciona intestinalis]
MDENGTSQHIVRREKGLAKNKENKIPKDEKVELKREVSLVGGISLIVGTMIGSGIFVSPKGVMRNAGSLGAGFLIWLGCGVLATFGALSYAEVGTMIPKSGGEFPILLEAFGPIPAYLFAWTSTVVLKPSSLALLSLTFAKYALAPAYNIECSEPSELAVKFTAVAVILIVIFINCASVKLSTQFLTVFSFGKVLSLLIIIIGGIVMLAQGHTQYFENAFDGEAPGVREVALGFYQGLWAFDGWNQLNYVIEELKNPYVNLPRAVVAAMALVTGLYMLTNVAYFTTMSMQELLASPAVAATFGDTVLGVMVWVIPVFVCWSVFGTCLGSCFTAGRISYVAAREGHFTKVLAMLHAKRMTPAPAVLLNGFIAILMVIPNDFDTLIDYFSFSMWIFHGSTCAALLYFRYKLPDHPRPVKVPIFIPIIVCIAAVCLVMAPIIDDPKIHYLFAFMFIMSGLAFYFPFVHYKARSKKLRTFNIFLQKLLFVTLPDEVEEND